MLTKARQASLRFTSHLDESLGLRKQTISGKNGCNSTPFSALPQRSHRAKLFNKAEKEQLIPTNFIKDLAEWASEEESFGRNRRYCETLGIRRILRQAELALGNENTGQDSQHWPRTTYKLCTCCTLAS